MKLRKETNDLEMIDIGASYRRKKNIKKSIIKVLRFLLVYIIAVISVAIPYLIAIYLVDKWYSHTTLFIYKFVAMIIALGVLEYFCCKFAKWWIIFISDILEKKRG